MAEPTTHNTLTDGPVTVDVAITFVPTTDATTGRELSDDERKQHAQGIVETAAQNDQWKKSLALPAVDHVQIAAQPAIVQPASDDDADDAPQAPAEAPVTGGTGGTDQANTPATPAPASTEAPATAPSQEPPPPPAAPATGGL